MHRNLEILSDEAVVQIAQKGSRRATEYLIAKYRELAKQKAIHYYMTGSDRDDVVQEGMIGIFKAIRDYDASRKASFRTFVDLCISRQIQTAITGANREKNRILNESLSLSAPALTSQAEGDLTELLPATGTDWEPEKMALISEVVRGITQENAPMFSALEQKVLEHLLLGKGYRQIAQELGRPPKSVDNAIQRIRKKITQALQ